MANSRDQTGRKRNLTVVAILMDDAGRVLLTRRHQPSSNHTHGKWQLPGGGIDHKEHPVRALEREIQEELGDLTVKILSENPFLHSNYFSSVDTHTILLGFPVQYISGTVDISKDEEASEAQWFTLEEIKELESFDGTLELAERGLTYQ